MGATAGVVNADSASLTHNGCYANLVRSPIEHRSRPVRAGAMSRQMKLTSTQQRNAVSEGSALGLLMCGRDALPYNKITVDLSFAGHGGHGPSPHASRK